MRRFSGFARAGSLANSLCRDSLCRTLAAGLALAGAALAQGPTVITSSLPQGSVGVSYQAGLTASGGASPYRWTSAGALPPGLTVSSSGSLSGIPSTAGTFNFAVTVTDANQLSASQPLSVTINSGVFLITTNSPLPNATIGVSYSQTLSASGGTPPYQWTVGQGLPAGVSLAAATGIISGVATTAGNYTFAIQVTDSARNSATENFALTVSGPAITITTISPLFSGTVGTAYNQAFAASGGTPPYQWSVTSGATDGLTLNASSGALTGTPQSAGTFTFVVRVSDSATASATQQFSLTVNGPSLTIVSGGTLAPGSVGVSYNQNLPLTVTGGSPPYSWTVSAGSVPGLTLNPVSEALTGTPTTAGTFSLTIQVTDSSQPQLTATKSLSLTIAAAALTITTSRQLPDASLNTPYNQPIAASGGVPPYTWSVNGLPAGLSINSTTGTISGTPTAAGSFGVAITVSDTALTHYSDRFALNVDEPPAPPTTITGLPSTVAPVTQFPLQIAIGSAYPSDITGEAIITFTPTTGTGDGTIQFSSGGTTAAFTISAGSLTAPALALQTGSVAGTIVVSLRLSAGGIDITPNPAPSATAQVAAAAPVIKGVQVTKSSSAIAVAVTGYSTALTVTQAVFTFSATAGQSLQSTASSITVDVTGLFNAWFQNASNSQFGSQFVFTQPFTVAGNASDVIVGTVTLTNSAGSVTFTVNQ